MLHCQLVNVFERNRANSRAFLGDTFPVKLTRVIKGLLIFRYGRRLPLAVALAVAIISQVILLNVRMEMYNACKRMNSPEGETTQHVNELNY